MLRYLAVVAAWTGVIAVDPMTPYYIQFYSTDECVGRLYDQYYVTMNGCATYHNTHSFKFLLQFGQVLVQQFRGLTCEGDPLNYTTVSTPACVAIHEPVDTVGRSFRISTASTSAWPVAKDSTAALQRCAHGGGCGTQCGNAHFGLRSSGFCQVVGSRAQITTCGVGGQFLTIKFTSADCTDRNSLQYADVITADTDQCAVESDGSAARVVSCHRDANTCEFACSVRGTTSCLFALSSQSLEHKRAIRDGYALPNGAVAACATGSWPTNHTLPVCSDGRPVGLKCIAPTDDTAADVSEFITIDALRAFLHGRVAFVDPGGRNNAFCGDAYGRLQATCPSGVVACSRCFHPAPVTARQSTIPPSPQAPPPRENGRVIIVCHTNDPQACFERAACNGYTEGATCYDAFGQITQCPTCPGGGSSKSGWIALILCCVLIPLFCSSLLCLLVLLCRPRYKEGPYIPSIQNAATACQCPTVTIPPYDAATIEAIVEMHAPPPPPMGPTAASMPYYMGPPPSITPNLLYPHLMT